MRPPEWILLEHLVLLEVLTNTPALVVGQRQAILLEEGVDSRHSAIPRVLEVVERQSAVLSLGLFSLEGVLGPDTLAVNVLGLP